ncbi:adenylate/guanylate cyclase domain-containing protein, partial [Candidatus Riflebacteria bacterium]
IEEEQKSQLFVKEFSNDPRISKLIKRFQIIQDVSNFLRTTLEIDQLLNQIMMQLFKVLNCDTGYILVIDPKNLQKIQWHLAYEKGVLAKNLEEKFYSKTLVNHVLENKTGIIFDLDEGSDVNLAVSIMNLSIKTAICCPIYTEEKVFGVIYLDNKRGGNKFEEDDLELMMSIAGIAGVAIENIQLYKKLHTEELIRNNLKRFVSPNIADQIVQEEGLGKFHLGSEKKNISILFADIRGFTVISENLSSMDVVNLLNKYFKAMCEIIFANGGTLDKFMGDCIMVLFGAPFPIDNQEERAVKTAMMMRDETQKLMPIWTAEGLPQFSVGIGIHCGEAVVGSIGTDTRMEYTAIGDNVNIASRLCSHAAKEQILISEELFNKVKAHFSTNPLEPIKVKGKSLALKVHEILSQ